MTYIDISIHRKIYPNIGKVEELVVIKNLHLSINQMEFVCLVGPSGCGKTTLLNIIGGLDKEFEGEIKITGKGLSDPKIGYVFQNPRLLPWRTARENIELALQPGQSPDQIDGLLQSMGLADIAHAYPERLSLGMSRRVALARAFAMEPDLLIMDEPFASLDPPTARRVRQLLLKVWDQRPHTVLFVTHDLREAIALADRLLFLTPPPMSLLHDVLVDIPRSQRYCDDTLETFRKSLNHKYKGIETLL